MSEINWKKLLLVIHSENIYRKLDVPGRHQAVAKAKGLAVIHTG